MSFHRLFSVKSTLLSPVALLAMFLVLVLATSPARAQVIADFNDLTAGNLASSPVGPQAGGTGFTGNWGVTGLTGVVDVVSGDLSGPSGTSYGILQSGTPLSVQSINPSASRRAARNIDPLALPASTDPIWFSFLASNTTAGQAAGIDFNNAGSSTVLNVDERILLDGTDLFIGGTTGGTVDVSSKYSLGGTGLVLGRLATGGIGDPEALDLWFNPDLSGGESGLLGLTPDFTQSDLMWDIDGISILGLQSVIDSGFNGGIIDNVRLSNSVTAFVDVVGMPLLPEWDVDANGVWGLASNWSSDPTIPDGGLEAVFGSKITANRTVTLDQDRSVSNVTFDNANSYTLTANKLTVTGSISTLQGSHTIASELELSGGQKTLTVPAGANLDVTGTLTTTADAAATLILDGAGGGSLGAIRDNNDLSNALDGTDNIAVVKRGSGTWTIGAGTTVGEDAHGGNTTVEAGTLRVNGTGSDGELRSPTISVQSGATFDTSDFTQYTLQVDQRLEGAGTVSTGSGDLRVSGAATVSPGDNGAGTLNVTGDLTLAGGLGGTQGSMIFELSSTSGGDNDQVVVSGDLDSNGGSGTTTISVIPTGTSLDSSYDLITFGGTYTGDGAADFSIDASQQTRFTQTVSVDADSVNLNISGNNASVVWSANVSDIWDVNSTQNWTNGGPDVFFDLDNATFDDTATGSGTVDIAANVSPASTTINNTSKDYNFSGIGSIAGAGSVTKSGTGRATISTANTYSGTTTVTGGVLHAANNAALGSTAGGTTVNGGALDITGSNIAGETVTIQGAGSDGRGALMTDGLDALGGSAQQMTAVVQDGDATIAAYYDGVDAEFNQLDYRWDLEPGGGLATSWQGNGHNLTKKGRGAIAINSTGEMNVGNINVDEGSLQFYGTATSTGSTVTVGTGSPLQEDFTGNPELRIFNGVQFAGPPPPGATQSMNIVLDGGVLNNEASDLPEFTLSGSIQTLDVTGDAEVDNVINSFSTSTKIQNGITGTGGVEFGSNSTGTTELQGNNTYTGNTRVEGNLALTGTGQLSGTPQIDVDGPAGVLDVTGRTDGTLTLTNQTLNVNDDGTFSGAIAATGTSVVSVSSANTINGNVAIASGSRLIGKKNSTDLGAGRVAGNVVIQSGGTLQVDTGLGTAQVIDNAFQQNGALMIGGHRYLAFEAEDFTNFNDIGTTITWEVEADGSALGGDKLIASGAQDTSTGNDDTVQYDMVFTEPGTYYWYVRTQSGGTNQNDSFYGPNQDATTSSASVAPGGGLSRFGISDELKDAEGANGITTSWDWVRSDPDAAAQGSFVDFEKIVVTQDDVDAGRLFSLQFEPRQAGAQLDKMVLADTFDFADIDDTLLDGATSLTSGLVNIDAPFLTFAIDGDLDLNAGSTMALDVRSLADFDNLSVTGFSDLDGTITVSANNFAPAISDTFTVLTSGTIDINGLSVLGGFSPSIVGTDLVLTFTGFDGDFDFDGDVDGSDFLAWQRTNGTADGLAAWQSNYGNPLSAVSGSSAVPEPTTLGLCLLGIAMGGGLLRMRA